MYHTFPVKTVHNSLFTIALVLLGVPGIFEPAYADMFTDVKYMQQVKQEQKENSAKGRADLYSAGTLATAQGGHGTQYGFPIPTIASPADALAWVHSRVLEGSDYIKIVYDDCRIYG